MLSLAAAAAGGRRRLVDLCATPPSAFKWDEPLGQAPIPPWPTWPRDTKIMVLFITCLVGLLIFCCICTILRRFCRNIEDDQDTSRFVFGNNNDGRSVSSPPSLQQEQQSPVLADEIRAADVEIALGDVPLTQAGVEWMLANLELLTPAVDMDMAPAVDEEIAPAPEPGPTLKCTFSTAQGWAEGTCSVCLSELVDGEKVRVLTACMHCFHATCITKWLRRGNATCPLCRAPVMILPARGRRRRRTQG